jgi:hypothetical protein
MLRRLRGLVFWVATAALVGAGCLLPAAAGTGSPGHARLTVHDDVRDLVHAATKIQRPTSLTALRQWRAGVAAARHRLLGAADGGGVAIAAAPIGETLLVPGGGHDDIATLTFPASTSTLKVRDGRTGRTLWSKVTPTAFSMDLAALGPKHIAALVVYETSFTGTASDDPTGLEDNGEQVTSVVAYAATTGQVIWSSQPITGAYSVSDLGFSEVDAVYDAGILHDRAGDRVLALEVSDSGSDVTSSSLGQAIVLDGTSGAEVASGRANVGVDLVLPVPAGDLNHDGFADWYVTADGTTGVVNAESGADGSQLWSQTEAMSSYLFVQPALDLDSDGAPDAVVIDEGSGTSSALSGASGAVLWTRPAELAFPLGRLPAGAAVGIASFAGSGGLNVTAVGPHDKTLWTRTMSPPDVEGDFGGVAAEFGLAGDVDADHVTDLFMSVGYVSTEKSGSYTDILSGRTGRVSRGRSLGSPILASLDGHGDDFLSTTAATSTWATTAYDGASRAKLWRFSTRTSAGKTFGFAGGVGSFGPRGRRCVLFVLFDNGQSRLIALDGRNGHQEWSVTA